MPRGQKDSIDRCVFFGALLICWRQHAIGSVEGFYRIMDARLAGFITLGIQGIGQCLKIRKFL